MTARAAPDTARTSLAYRRGWWVRSTLAGAARAAAQRTPERIAVVDNEVRLNCATLYAQSGELAAAPLARMPAGSVVSFMLPNWHDAAVIYLAATLAGMVVNPILPSLRDHDLRFILEDARAAMVFVPHRYGGHDYPAMLDRVTAAMSAAPQVVVLRGPDTGRTGWHTPYAPCWADRPVPFRPWIPMRCG